MPCRFSYLQVKGLRAWCLDLDSEACVLDYNHFLFVPFIAVLGVPAPVLLLGAMGRAVPVHHRHVCRVPWGDSEGRNHIKVLAACIK